MNACKLWTKSVDTHGYPHGQVNGKLQLICRVVLANKLGRPIKPGLCALHHCDVRRCIEPTHLYEGSHKQNAADRDGRKRRAPPKGTMNGRAILTEDDVRAIRKSTKNNHVLAVEYGVTIPAIWHIKHRRTWSHVT